MRNIGKLRSPIALKREGRMSECTYVILENGITTSVSALLYNAKHGVDGAIRIQKDEYEQIDTALPFYTHFNLQFCGHRIGSTYALPRILTQGYFVDDADQLPPLLSFEGALMGTCTKVQEHIPYNMITNDIFRYSMRHIQSVDELKSAILRRYKISMPSLSDEKILSLGVSITTLKFS